MTPGSIVRCRNREWVLLPSENEEVCLLRPLAGAADEVVAVHRRLGELFSNELPEESIRPATFPPPAIDDAADASGVRLLWQAARLTLREGATPFRSLGRISIRPRVYQFVPLMMALRLDPVRLLIADDVGVGKTVEALLIARELLDRGEVKRLCVLCPPYLCDQWRTELALKFNLEAVVVGPATIGQLERRKRGAGSLYQYYPIQVASIDFLKSDRNKHQFLPDCPELVIVDEAHGAATAENNQQQQRHKLLREIAARADRHLILLTATPHSGVESAFRSLLGLLRPEFGDWDAARLTEDQRREVARHFVQRTRQDIVRDWEGEHCFPRREARDLTYRLSRPYQELFEATYDFCLAMVRDGETLDRRRRRARYWGALALLRCVMSSPAAAVAALQARRATTEVENFVGEDEPDFRPFVLDTPDNGSDDDQPTPAVEAAEATLEAAEQRRLERLTRQAEELIGSRDDTKLEGCLAAVEQTLSNGGHPIVWCRYVATAEYVAAALRRRLQESHPKAQVACVTGRQPDEERRARIAAIAADEPRVLVATDCLSEGVNLQERFTAALHYDLPWNPNRLEQREGRVDRYGQTAPVVTAIRYFSPDNPVDGVVIEVLLKKAREIYQALGTHVPAPEASDSVTEAVLNALFLRGRRTSPVQMSLDLGPEVSPVKALHADWDRAVERERSNRTRYAQRALKPAQVQRELEAVDGVLGDPAAVREFVLTAGQRLSLNIAKESRDDVFRLAVAAAATAALPPAARTALPTAKDGFWRVTFTSPTPDGAEYLGRNHPFVAALANFLLEESLTKPTGATAPRCGAMATRAVERLTTLYLLRVRYLVRLPNCAPLLSEETLVVGDEQTEAGDLEAMATEAASALLQRAQPDANLAVEQKRARVAAALEAWPVREASFQRFINQRATELADGHRRVRQSVGLRVRELQVEPRLPPDLLGLLVLLPVS